MRTSQPEPRIPRLQPWGGLNQATIDPSRAAQLFIVDCEAPTTSPVTGPLVEFAVVHVITGMALRGRLWDWVPSEENPAIPVPVKPRTLLAWSSPHSQGTRPADDENDVFAALSNWLAHFEVKPVFVSDNPAYDWQWIAAGFARADLENPFGYSARRIGDFAAGMVPDWQQSSAWKELRRTGHTHDPLDDARGNAEALRVLLGLSDPLDEAEQ